ncbi:hypothetical protein COU01_03515 [Candidatus Falkowbacteria bacterium CG10_big_fil_rev_8_21_14_0_10_44_15]|uniref:N-acetyltransferase domain-containing protein n=1 Tax=Candidatus Falkowbacteria bacterium CG10_big_fil_rev_8_21_14_0_10_44_15 TaxID=1974569 RepID=A0A2H0UZ42_9BACT|nr:MAG: hypothetical protein COU01_03515 [Candidatus Falkowbacteria bacterium CG10_big_fil_rev_8_21_14_0_10_44_15]
MKIQIRGKKINLRALAPSDARSIFANVNDRQVSRYLKRIPYPYALRDAKAIIKKARQAGRKKIKTDYYFGMEDKTSRQIIGMVGLHKISPRDQNAEVGYWLGRKYWRQGIGTEALTLILQFAFGKLKLNMLYAGAMSSNVASQSLLAKCGFKRGGRRRQTFFREGKYLDDIFFDILKKEFKQ